MAASTGNPFVIDQSALGRGLQQAGQAVGSYFQKQDAQEQQALAEQQKQDRDAQLMDFIDSSNIQGVTQMMIENPQMAEGIETTWNFKDNASRQNLADSAIRVLQGEDPKKVYGERAATLENPEQTMAEIDAPKEEQMAAAKMMIAMYGTPDQKKAVDAMAQRKPMSGKGSGGFDDPNIPSNVRSTMWLEQATEPQKQLFYKSEGSELPIEERLANAEALAEVKGNQDILTAERKQGIGELGAISKNISKINSESRNISQLKKLSSKAFSGGAAGAKMAMAKLADNIGIDVAGLPESEQFATISNAIVLDKSQQMSGALSEGDMAFLKDTAPTLSQTKEGRDKIIEYAEKLNKRERKRATKAQQFRKKNGYFSLPEFEEEMREWADENPLFKKDETEGSGSGKPIIKANTGELNNLSDADLLKGLGIEYGN